eukprot:evm.model.NODE_1915_length_20035_cov_46.721489.4
MTLGSSQGISSKVGVGDAGEPNSAATAESALQATQAATDLSMNGREFIEASFGPGATSTWLLDIIPPDAAPLSVLSTGLVAKTLSEDTSYFLRNFAQGAGALGMMFYTSPQICAIMLGVIPPVALWGVFFGRKVRALSKQMVDELAQ